MTTSLRRKKCDVVSREFDHARDLHWINSAWDFFGDGPSNWCVSMECTCRHSYEVVSDSQCEDDTTYREYFQCIHCKEKLQVQITFGCPICHGRHLQFIGLCGSNYYFCPQNPVVPFHKSEIRGAQFEVLITPYEHHSSFK